MITNKNNIMKTFVYSLIMLFVLSSNIHAENWKDLNISEKEKAVFAYFRAANVPPDYDSWIKSKPAYERQSESKKEEYFIDEMLRLGRGYSAFNNRVETLKIHSKVLSQYIPAPDDTETDEKQKNKIIFHFFNADESYVPTFDYAYGNDRISLIVNNLAYFADIKLQQAQDKIVSSKVPYTKDFFDSELELHVRVTKVDRSRSIRKKEGSTWVMIGEIGYIKCTTNPAFGGEKYMLWDYVAPWYEAELYKINNPEPEEEKYPHPFDLYKD